MCCQFHVNEETEEALSKKFNSGVVLEKGLMKPSSKVSILTSNGIGTMTWGFQNPKGSSLLINARSESIEEKPTFRWSYENQRCVIAASIFYEYNSHKERVGFCLPSSPVLFMAGIFQDGRFTVLTVSANDSVSPFHDRMPLLLSHEHLDAYLLDRERASLLKKERMPLLQAKLESSQLEFQFD